MTKPSQPPVPPSLAAAPWLVRAETQAVFHAIAGAGFAVRIVGGSVRNALLGVPVKDVDFATTAPPQEVMLLAAAAGLSAVPTGIAHGTVTVLANHVPFEVTTLRQDVETFGRHARVAFTGDWAADAARRDFTFNALYCEADGRVFDPLGGYGDLVARRVRFIGDPHARIREDYLRIMRFFRFHAEYGADGLDAASLAACIAERAGLAGLSGERLRGELLRLLAAPGALGSITAMAAGGILGVVVPEPADLAVLERLISIERAVGHPADAVLRLAALALPAATPAALRDRLRLTGEEARRLARLAEPLPGLTRDADAAWAKVAIYRCGADAFRDMLLLGWARSGDATDAGGWQALLRLSRHWRVPQLPVRGADLLARGVPTGPQVGRILERLEDWWLAAGFPESAGEIAARLDALIAEAGPQPPR